MCMPMSSLAMQSNHGIVSLFFHSFPYTQGTQLSRLYNPKENTVICFSTRKWKVRVYNTKVVTRSNCSILWPAFKISLLLVKLWSVLLYYFSATGLVTSTDILSILKAFCGDRTKPADIQREVLQLTEKVLCCIQACSCVYSQFVTCIQYLVLPEEEHHLLLLYQTQLVLLEQFETQVHSHCLWFAQNVR